MDTPAAHQEEQHREAHEEQAVNDFRVGKRVVGMEVRRCAAGQSAGVAVEAEVGVEASRRRCTWDEVDTSLAGRQPDSLGPKQSGDEEGEGDQVEVLLEDDKDKEYNKDKEQNGEVEDRVVRGQVDMYTRGKAEGSKYFVNVQYTELDARIRMLDHSTKDRRLLGS